MNVCVCLIICKCIGVFVCYGIYGCFKFVLDCCDMWLDLLVCVLCVVVV